MMSWKWISVPAFLAAAVCFVVTYQVNRKPS